MPRAADAQPGPSCPGRPFALQTGRSAPAALARRGAVRDPRRLAVAALALLALLLAAPMAAAVTLLNDPEGDLALDEPDVPPVQPPTFRHVDIRIADATEMGDTLDLRVTFAGDVTERQRVEASFEVHKGPDSLPESRASGLRHTLLWEEGSMRGPAGLDGGPEGPDLHFRVPLLAIGAVGGDMLTDLVVTSSDTDPGLLPEPAAQDDTTATDQAPDTGASTPYRFNRAPVRPGIALSVTGGHIVATNGTRTAAAGPTQTLHEGDEEVRLTIQVVNSGSDPDVVTLAAAGDLGATLSPTELTLAPGAAGITTLTARPAVAGGEALEGRLTASSARGGSASLALSFRVDEVPVPAEREVKPAGLGFLTPVARAMRADAAFGSYAELAILLALLLMLVAGTFLAVSLVRTPWVRVRMEPSLVVATPGSVAEVRIKLDKAKARVKHAKAVLRDAGTWGATLLRRGRTDTHRTIQLEPDSTDGLLRVRIPPDARPKDRETIELDIVPVDEDGTEHPDRARHARVTVQAAVPTTVVPGAGFVNSRDIRLAAVHHEPSHPLPGGTVVTTATVQNGGEVAAPLRVVLLLDGRPVLEERIEVPPRQSRPVTLPWTAGSGKNQVKVQVFLA